jgi:hypothetical protein
MTEANNAEKPVLGRIPVNTPEQKIIRDMTSPGARIAYVLADGARDVGSKISKATRDEKGWHITLVQPDGSEIPIWTLNDDEAAMFIGILGKPEKPQTK